MTPNYHAMAHPQFVEGVATEKLAASTLTLRLPD